MKLIEFIVTASLASGVFMVVVYVYRRMRFESQYARFRAEREVRRNQWLAGRGR